MFAAYIYMYMYMYTSVDYTMFTCAYTSISTSANDNRAACLTKTTTQYTGNNDVQSNDDVKTRYNVTTRYDISQSVSVRWSQLTASVGS